MASFDIYLVRHGETTANRDNILQGHSDFPLTELGIEQAKTVGIKLHSHSWYKVYSSDLYRALHTTKLALEHSVANSSHVNKIQQSEWLREIYFGVREGMSRSLNAKEAKIEYARINNLNVHDVIDNAETMESVRNRQKNFITTLLSDHLVECNSAETNTEYAYDQDSPTTSAQSESLKILCVTHGGYIKHFLRHFCLDLPHIEKIGNCTVSVVTIAWCDVNHPELFTCTAREDCVNISCDNIDDVLLKIC